MIKTMIGFRILKLGLLLCILSLGLCISQAYAQNTAQAYVSLNSNPVISMDLKDASIKDVLKAFSIQSGMNFIASQEIEDRKLTLYLDNVSAREAMDNLFKANNLTYEFDEQAKIILVKKAEALLQTITKVFPLKYASVSTSSIQEEMNNHLTSDSDSGGGESGRWVTEEKAGITSVIKDLLSSVGKLVEDPRTNSLVITDLPSRFPGIEKTIRQLDVPVPQVMLEVEMLDVSKNVVDKLGFEFGENPMTLLLPGGLKHLDFFFVDSAGSAEGATGALTLGSSYRALLDFLRIQTDTRDLARPRILTLDNETAEISITANAVIGEELQYNEAGVVTGRTAERADTGISLRITPQINMETREVTMFVVPEVIEAAVSSFSSSYSSYRDSEERGTKSLIKVYDGETVVIGGLIRKVKNEVVKKLPILGDLPIIGALFRHINKSKNIERELLVFITPHILQDAYASASLLETRSEILSSREQGSSFTEVRTLNIEAALNNLDAAR